MPSLPAFLPNRDNIETAPGGASISPIHSPDPSMRSTAEAPALQLASNGVSHH
jgi:hypothetical protein